MFYKHFTFSLVILLSACTITAPADDGYENSNEWVDNGRLLPDEVKIIYSSAENLTEGFDYNAYQDWLNAMENNTLEYQKFRQWQEFEKYYRWKQQSQ